MAKRYIPTGREDLYRRQAIADAEVTRLESAHKAAERKARELAQVLDRDDALVEDAEAEADRLYDEWGRAQAVADRIHQERTAGLSSWIDTNPHLPVCSECGGTGGPRLACGGIEDARTSCRTCRGWGREDDGRGNLPAWNEKDQCWCDPATGRKVDIPEPSLDDPPKKNDPPTTRTTGPTGATMSKFLDGQQLLLRAAQQLEDLAPRVGGDGDPEELGQIQRAEQLEGEADQKMAEASGAPTAQAMAAHAGEAEELARQAEQLRQQAKEGLEARVANATTNAQTADEVQVKIREAVEGTHRGGEMIPTAGAIHNAIEESGTALAGAASVATEREQTHACLGMIKQAQDHATVAAGLCGRLHGDIEQYVGGL